MAPTEVDRLVVRAGLAPDELPTVPTGHRVPDPPSNSDGTVWVVLAALVIGAAVGVSIPFWGLR